MVRVQNIKDNPRCVASITVRVRKTKSEMRVGSKTHKILGIFHRPSSSVATNTKTSDHERLKDS